MKYDEFVNSLITVAVAADSEEDLRDVSVDAIMDFAKLGKGGRFQSAVYHKFLHNIIQSMSSIDPLLDLFATKYLKYIDVRYFTYTSMDKIAKTCESTAHVESRKLSSNDKEELPESRLEYEIRNIFNILSRVPPLEAEDKETIHDMLSDSGLLYQETGKAQSEILDADAKPKKSKKKKCDVSSTGHISRKLKLKFTKAWLSFLKLPLPLDVYKEVLVTLHQNVIPYMSNPAILCDFLTSSYAIGGVISVMALSGLFTLMTQHGLEYPKFYEKLYALLTPAVFMAKHRAVFFQLLDTCLKSSYLPAYLAAAFAKKLSRLSLLVPPQGALVIIATIHNLLRRHPSINFLVHQEVDTEVDEDTTVIEGEENNVAREPDASHAMHTKKQCLDPFNDEETDPAKSDAMRSSLWELDTLRHHYCPAVSRFVASLENDLTVRAKTSEVNVTDFSSGSYATIFGEEMRRRIKQVPLAFYQASPSSLFWGSEFSGWTFDDLQSDATVNGDQEFLKRHRIESY